MAIRIQPVDIKVPEDDPFRYDLLNRKDAADVLTRIVGEIEGPCVLAIDAEWGAGKTTFLNMWAQELRNKGFPVAKFNAWETDFAGDPLLALIDELTNAIGEDGSASLQETAKELVVRTAPNLLKFIPIGGDALASIAKDGIDYFTENRLSEYQKLKEEVCEFKRALTAAAGALSSDNEGRPLVVVIDELDRCRPSYAVELLEIAKHWFMVDHIVFVLAVNRSQLAHSIRVLYGVDFNADGYLGRFFDQDFLLPESDRKAFVDAVMLRIPWDSYFDANRRRAERNVINQGIDVLRGFLMLPSLSLREVEQAMRRLQMMLAQFDAPTVAIAVTSIVALMLRTNNRDVYSRFLKGSVPDDEVADAIFGDPAISTVRCTDRGALITAAIIVAAQPDGSFRQNFGDVTSALLQKYRDLADGNEHANRVLDQASYMWRDRQYNLGVSGFKAAIQRLELLSADQVMR